MAPPRFSDADDESSSEDSATAAQTTELLAGAGSAKAASDSDGERGSRRKRGDKPETPSKKHPRPSGGAAGDTPRSSVKSSTGNRGKPGGRKGGQVKKTKAGCKTCRGCGQEFDASYSKTSVAFCDDDNRALGRIESMARTQGAEMVKWVSEVRRDDKRVKAMLKSYWVGVGGKPKWKSKTPTGAKWSLAEYKESVEVITNVEKTMKGQMMWKRQYTEFAQTTNGGKLTEAEAEQNWQSWVARLTANPHDPDLFWDKDGPVQAPLQFRVKTKKEIDFKSIYSHKKSLDLTQKLGKEVNEEMLQKFRLQAMTGHDQVAAAGSNVVDFNAIGARLARSVGSDDAVGSSFSGLNMKLQGDVRRLLKDGDGASTDEEGSGHEADGSEKEKEKGKDKGAPNLNKWFDRDITIARAKRTVDDGLTTLWQKMEESKVEAAQIVEQAEQTPPEDKPLLRDELTILKTRLEGIYSLEKQQEDVNAYIQSFDRELGEAKPTKVGSAPPFKTYAGLKSKAFVIDLLDKFDSVSGKEELENLIKDITSHKKPITALIAAVGAGKKGMDKAFERIAERKAKRKADEEVAASKQKQKVGDCSIFEAGLSLAQQVFTVSTPAAMGNLLRSDASSSIWSAPLLIAKAAIVQQAADLLQVPNFKKQMDAAKKEFVDEEKKTKGNRLRGGLEMEDPAHIEGVKAFMKSMCPHTQVVATGNEDHAMVAQAITPQFFGMSAHNPYCQAERGRLPCMRWQYSGIRVVIVTAESQLIKFMKARNPGVEPSFSQAWNFLKSMPPNLLAAYSENQGTHSLFTCTIGTGDVFYVPTAFCIAEQGQQEITSGVKMSMLPSCQTHVEPLRNVYTELQANGEAK